MTQRRITPRAVVHIDGKDVTLRCKTEAAAEFVSKSCIGLSIEKLVKDEIGTGRGGCSYYVSSFQVMKAVASCIYEVPSAGAVASRIATVECDVEIESVADRTDHAKNIQGS